MSRQSTYLGMMTTCLDLLCVHVNRLSSYLYYLAGHLSIPESDKKYDK